MILTEEQLLIQETARKFAQQRLAPNSAQWERQAAFPRNIFRELGELGFMGVTVPVEWGGAGADNVPTPSCCRRSPLVMVRSPPC